MREWMIALGILVVVAVALDCVRRIRANSRDSLQWSNNLARGMQAGRGDDPLGLDNTGTGDVRISSRDNNGDDIDDPYVDDHDTVGVDTGAVRSTLDLSQIAPILMDVNEHDRVEPGLGGDDLGLDETQPLATQQRTSEAYSLSASRDDDEDSDSEEYVATQPVPQPTQPPIQQSPIQQAAPQPVLDSATTPLSAGESDVLGAPRIFARPDDQAPPRRPPPVKKEVKPVLTAQRDKARQLEQQAAEQQSRQQQLLLEEYVLVNVMARDKSRFSGTALLEAMVSSGLCYGHQKLFHYYVGEDREDESLFSVVNVLKPGTFDLNHMEDFNTPGIGLILRLPVPMQSMAAFEIMMKTAQHLADALDGELRDEHRNAMTSQTIGHYRERVRDFDMQLQLHTR